MPKLKITKYNVDKLEFTQQGTVDYWDDKLKGFGLRVGTESKTFLVKANAKTKDGYKTVKSVIGKYGLYTVEQAREVAQERILKLKQGDEPIERKAVVLRDMIEKYLESKKLASVTEKSYCSRIPAKFATWMDLSLNELSALEPETVIGRFNAIVAEHGRVSARSVFEHLQAILNYARILYPKDIVRNPINVLSQAKLWPKIESRTDCLRGNDFKQFYDVLGPVNLPEYRRIETTSSNKPPIAFSFATGGLNLRVMPLSDLSSGSLALQ